METYSRAAVERAMKVQEVIMRAMAEKITWAQVGEDHRIVQATDASMERRVGTLAAGTAPPRIHSVASANEFLRESYIAEFNQRFPGGTDPAGPRVSTATRKESGSDLCTAP